MAELTAQELNLITNHLSNILNKQMDAIKEHMDSRIQNTEEMFSMQVKGLQLVHETNYSALLNEIKTVGVTATNGLNQATITNGRMTKVEGIIHGEFDTNCQPIKGREGMLKKFEEIEKYRPIYKEPLTIVAIFIMMCFIFIKESRDMIMNWLGLN